LTIGGVPASESRDHFYALNSRHGGRERLVGRLALVIDYFRAIDDPRQLWDSDGSGSQISIWKHPRQEAEIDSLAAALEAENKMLSVDETRRVLLYEAVVPSVHALFGDRNAASTDVADGMIARLLSFERFTLVELPVLYLAAKEPLTVTNVEFESLDIDHFKESTFGAWTYGLYDGRLMAKARINSPGDEWKRLTNAVEGIDRALRLLSGLVFPWQVTQAVVPAIPGNGQQPGSTPFRFPHDGYDAGWNGSFGTLHRPGGSMNPRKVIRELWGVDAGAIAEWMLSPGSTATERRLLTAYQWLGEACRGHDRSGRFVAAVTALEALLALKNDESRTSAGATAILAERTAFLGAAPETRLATHREVVRLYALRSDVVHGRAADLVQADVVAAGQLAWTVARTLFANRDSLRSDDEVTRWILMRRYQDR
jgi:hypothetical protein